MPQEIHDALLNLGLAALIRLFISNLDEQKINVMVQRPALLPSQPSDLQFRVPHYYLLQARHKYAPILET